MKIVNINEYNENDGLKRKLRQRMDAYEPELSGSVWDRIQHEMDERDINRKKRFLWWLSSVAIIVLAGSIIGFLVFGGEPQNKQTVQQTPAQTQVSGDVNNTPNNGSVSGSETLLAETEAAPIATVPNTSTPTTANGGTTNAATPTQHTRRPTTNNNGGGTTPITNRDNTELNNGSSVPTIPSTTNNEGSETQANTAKPVEGENIPSATEGEQPIVIGENLNEQEGDGAKTDENKPTVSPAATSITDAEKKQRWFVGLMFGYNQTFRTVADINVALSYLPAKERNKFEQKSYSPTYGFEFGFYPIKNFFIKSGVSMYQTSEEVRYDIHKKSIPRASAYFGNPGDSVAVGNTTQHKNTYNYVQIPLEIGYSREVYKGLGIVVSGGVAYNMLKNHSYYLFEANYGNAFIPPSAAQAKPFNDMYKSYYMLSGSIGMQYSIGKYWVATLGVNYRKAITNAADEKYEVDIKPYSVGLNTGLAFKF